jgi:ribosomal protein S18 acetylase RimI-like enzyme
MRMADTVPPVFQLPATLLSQGFALRLEREDDLPFLIRLYASTREPELAITGWSSEQKQAFVLSQFQAQRRHYRTYIADCRFDVLECRGEPFGRLYLAFGPTRLNIVDIALLPEWCGRGIGTSLLRAVMETAEQSGRGVVIFVEKYNPALRLYRRLGFTEVQDVGMQFEMEWTPAGISTPVS